MAVIGIDFDNTIVSYDRVFYQAAVERGLVGSGISPSKREIRDELRATGKEDQWTELQAYVYGEYIAEADVFPGVIDFLRGCTERGLEVKVISHKTSRPYRGPDLDLRAAAKSWLKAKHLLDVSTTGLSLDNVYFEETKEAKMERIRISSCAAFIDDLPEFLGHTAFPPEVSRILFDPAGRADDSSRFVSCRSWAEIGDHIFLQFGA